MANKSAVILTTRIPEDEINGDDKNHNMAIQAWSYHLEKCAARGKDLTPVKLESKLKDVDFLYTTLIRNSVWLILVDVKYSARNSRPRFSEDHTFSENGLKRAYSELSHDFPLSRNLDNNMKQLLTDETTFIERTILIGATLDKINRFTVYLFNWSQIRVDMDYHIMSDILREEYIPHEEDEKYEMYYVAIFPARRLRHVDSY